MPYRTITPVSAWKAPVPQSWMVSTFKVAPRLVKPVTHILTMNNAL